MRTIIDYDKDNMKITNLEQLPRGLGLRYLLCLESPYPATYIAERWLRKMPESTPHGKVVVRLS